MHSSCGLIMFVCSFAGLLSTHCRVSCRQFDALLASESAKRGEISCISATIRMAWGRDPGAPYKEPNKLKILVSVVVAPLVHSWP